MELKEESFEIQFDLRNVNRTAIITFIILASNIPEFDIIHPEHEQSWNNHYDHVNNLEGESMILTEQVIKFDNDMDDHIEP